jgi:replicative DNA helicase
MAVLKDRIPPQSLEAEQATLGSMLISRAAIERAADILRPDDFYRDAHRMIFDAIVTLTSRDEPVDILTVQDQLKLREQLDTIGGTPYLVQLTDAVPSAANVEYYAKLVEERAILRRLIDASTQIAGMAHTEYDSVTEVVDKAEKAIFSVSQRRLGAYFTAMGPLVDQVYEQIEVRSTDADAFTGLKTHISDLNYITAGLQKSDLIIIAARPSMGKTALAMGIAEHVGIKLQQPVAVFSLEMAKEQLCMRMICSEARVDAHRLRTGKLDDADWPRVGEACSKLAEVPIFIDDTSDANAMEMRAKCRRLKAERGLALIVVDYLQLMRSHRSTENRVQEIGEIARALKSLAREMEVPVIALSQLSRAVEQRENKRPMLSDLRESGSIEAEADVVVFIYRESYYDQKQQAMSAESDEFDAQARRERHAEKVETAELIVAKQRNGPTGKVLVSFLPQYARFDNRAVDRTE